MTVSARTAKHRPKAATVGLVDMRAGSPVRAGTFAYAGDDVETGWHTHDLHQVEYAFEGVAEVETAEARYLLPPQQAVWIPAGVEHNTTLRSVRSVSAFFSTSMVRVAGDRARVLAAAPVIREMLVHAIRWPITRASSDPLADAYFDVLAQLVVEWLDHEAPLRLPTSSEPVVAAAMAYTGEDLCAAVTEADVCRAVGVSPRTLRRRFPVATGMTWRRYVGQARLLRAMSLLAQPGPTVLDVATAVGFQSVSAFTRAFVTHAGETPTAYRRRVAG